MNFDKARHNMVTQQVRTWEVLNKDVLNAMLDIQREEFVPVSQRKLAFADMPLPIGHGEYMMKPVVEGRMLQALNIAPSDTVLEVGTGSGYVTALLCTLSQHVHSIDIIEEFVLSARQKLDEQGLDKATLEVQDFFTFKAPIKYDHVIITGSLTALPAVVFKWLKEQGQVFVIMGEDPIMEARIYTAATQYKTFFDTMVAPLKNNNAEKQPFNL